MGISVISCHNVVWTFTDIIRALRFDDKAMRSQHIAVQEIFDKFLGKCCSSYKCGASVTVDEHFISFHGNCQFRTFIPSKPGKYALKLWIMADSETFYCDDAQLYAGKVGNQTDVGQGMRVVLQLTESIAQSRRNVTTDNLFTNYQLATELQQRHFCIVGTVRSNKCEVPKEMLPSSDRAVYSSKFGFHDAKTLVSYVPKPRKAVILLSTQHHDNSMATDDKAKPDFIHYYNLTKSGVDILDKVVHTYSCKRATARWIVAFFLNMINIAAYSAPVMCITCNEQ